MCTNQVLMLSELTGPPLPDTPTRAAPSPPANRTQIQGAVAAAGLTLHEIGLACLQLLRLLSTGGCCTYFKVQSRTFRNRLGWMCSTYFSAEERVGLDVQQDPKKYWYQPEIYIGLMALSFGAYLEILSAL
jgi:hypothetical protein